ncbi:MAG: hypothetical protein ACLVAK_08335 [Clostridia bacterium]|jgi:hypothetical protein
MIKKVLREITKMEEEKAKKERQISDLQNEVAEIDENLKKYYNIKKQYEKVEASANELFNKNN